MADTDSEEGVAERPHDEYGRAIYAPKESEEGVAERPHDEYGRAIYAPKEIPPATERFALWRGRLTHPDAVVSDRKVHETSCRGGWIPSGEWWLHCGVCRG